VADKYYLETIEHKFRMGEEPTPAEWTNAFEEIVKMNAEIEELRIRLSRLTK